MDNSKRIWKCPKCGFKFFERWLRDAHAEMCFGAMPRRERRMI